MKEDIFVPLSLVQRADSGLNVQRGRISRRGSDILATNLFRDLDLPPTPSDTWPTILSTTSVATMSRNSSEKYKHRINYRFAATKEFLIKRSSSPLSWLLSAGGGASLNFFEPHPSPSSQSRASAELKPCLSQLSRPNYNFSLAKCYSSGVKI